jgi:hypothetical protein
MVLHETQLDLNPSTGLMSSRELKALPTSRMLMKTHDPIHFITLGYP